MTTISKADVLHAILTENLKPGLFYHVTSLENEAEELLTCPVCAVGAVLRKASVLNDYTASAQMQGESHKPSVNAYKEDVDRNIHRMLKKKKYIAALSWLFEDSCSRWDVETARRHCIEMVEKEFPDSLELVV